MVTLIVWAVIGTAVSYWSITKFFRQKDYYEWTGFEEDNPSLFYVFLSIGAGCVALWSLVMIGLILIVG